MKNILTLVLMLGLAVSVSAQSLTELKIQRFSASKPAASQSWTTTASIKSSQVDTTAWFEFNSITPNDTLLEAIVGTLADSMSASITVQYGTKGVATKTNLLDSIQYRVPLAAAGYNVPAKGKALWFTRPPGATMVRIIIGFSSTGNQNGLATQSQNKTYWAAIATRIKK